MNRVGVHINTASYKLLSYVSGLSLGTAKKIVNFRDSQGEFLSRKDLEKVPGLGPKTFEQAAGFLRVAESSEPLDRSAIHPERYSLVEKMAEGLNVSVKDLVGSKELIATINLEEYVSEEIGLPTLLDIADELAKPGRDPRESGSKFLF